MWGTGQIASLLVSRSGIYAAIALALVGAACVWRIQVLSLRSDVETHRNAALQAQEQTKALRSQLASATRQIQVQNDAEAARVARQQQIEGTRNARRQRNTSTLAKPENAQVADIVLPADMLDGLRDQ